MTETLDTGALRRKRVTVGYALQLAILSVFGLLKAGGLGNLVMMVAAACICTLGIAPSLLLLAMYPVARLLGVLFVPAPHPGGLGASLRAEARQAVSLKGRRERALAGFVQSSQKAGYSVPEIQRQLGSAGWSPEEIGRAFSRAASP
jgi:hypothetical protein